MSFGSFRWGKVEVEVALSRRSCSSGRACQTQAARGLSSAFRPPFYQLHALQCFVFAARGHVPELRSGAGRLLPTSLSSAARLHSQTGVFGPAGRGPCYRVFLPPRRSSPRQNKAKTSTGFYRIFHLPRRSNTAIPRSFSQCFARPCKRRGIGVKCLLAILPWAFGNCPFPPLNQRVLGSSPRRGTRGTRTYDESIHPARSPSLHRPSMTPFGGLPAGRLPLEHVRDVEGRHGRVHLPRHVDVHLRRLIALVPHERL